MQNIFGVVVLMVLLVCGSCPAKAAVQDVAAAKRGASPDAVAPDYVIDTGFNVGFGGKIASIALIDDSKMAIAMRDNKLVIADTVSGSAISKVQLEGDAPSAMTVDKSGNIYILCTSWKMKAMKYRGRSYKRRVANGLQCKVFDSTGKLKRKFDINGAKSAKSAAFLNGKLVVADDRSRSLAFVNPKDGSVDKKVGKGIRLCCGIFGIAPSQDGKNVLVANLGAFKVQSYNENGFSGFSFGKKGRRLQDFHGCCNPLNVAQLPGGAIITAEKDPTRIKIYNADGSRVKSIPGVEELVKGCYYIPMSIDSKGNIYLVAKSLRLIRLKQK
jgi:DNA-binding beta-propeller fold protein YncE